MKQPEDNTVHISERVRCVNQRLILTLVEILNQQRILKYNFVKKQTIHKSKKAKWKKFTSNQHF